MKNISKPYMLKKLLLKKESIISPCAYDVLSAKIIESAGFELVSTTGFGMHGAMLGVPDNGQLAFNEMAEALSKMADALTIPIMADAEGGYGNAINVIRTVRTFEKVGIGGIFIEDQKLPPNCPFIKETKVISVDEMCGKIKAAVESRRDPDFIIVARSDAPFEEAVERAKEYIKIGADMIKINPRTRSQLEELPSLINAPLHVGFDYNSELNKGLTAWDAAKMGYKIITFPTTALLSSVEAMKNAMEQLHKTGTDQGILSQIMPFKEYLKFIGKEYYDKLDKKYLTK